MDISLIWLTPSMTVKLTTMWKTVEVEEEEAMVPLGQMNLKEVVEEN